MLTRREGGVGGVARRVVGFVDIASVYFRNSCADLMYALRNYGLILYQRANAEYLVTSC